MDARVTRREFVQLAGLGAAGLSLPGCRTARQPRKLSANEKLNIGIIGVANQGNYHVTNLAGENIVALCDVDEKFLNGTAQKFPEAKTYSDFRHLLDQKDIDAIVVATPDHTHAVATMAALKSGRHVYCEKPLTHTISEARLVTEMARRQKLATQIGTQIHAGANYRRVVELIRSDVIGPVREVHVWAGASYGGRNRPADSPPVPPHLHYDLWLGPVDYRPYHPDYLPFTWRHYWAFGGGALADFGCHFMDLPHWALDLRYPESAEVLQGPPVHSESTPLWLIVRYEYPAHGARSALPLTWYHGGKQPAQLGPDKARDWKNGVLFIGEKGSVLADYSRHLLLPEKDFVGFVKPQPWIPNSIGHHQEWIQACKTGSPTTCSFDYSGPLTEAALLGNVAYRTGRKLDWDSRNLRARNCPEAKQFIEHQYRARWQL